MTDHDGLIGLQCIGVCVCVYVSVYVCACIMLYNQHKYYYIYIYIDQSINTYQYIHMMHQ